MNHIAIRKENIELTEKRSPMAPEQAAELIRQGLKVTVEPWANRFFDDASWRTAGAELSEDISRADIIFGVKEVPIDDLIPGKPHVFFSHTIKGQSYNMPLLQAILDKEVTLMDYEKVTDEKGRRLIFFGPYAGLAGAINGLWLLGRQMKKEGYNTPLSEIRQANTYKDLEDAKAALTAVGQKLKETGMPVSSHPWSVVITGGGTVSRGAQEIIDLMPVTEVTPVEFTDLANRNAFDAHVLYKVVIDCDHFVKPKAPGARFDWQDYFEHPENYEADFEKYLPYISLMINGIYWEKRYPKLITREQLRALYAERRPNLRVVADITCDPRGSVECTVHCTASDKPAYVYDPLSDEADESMQAHGPVVLAVDKLPSELPASATRFFGDMLLPFVPALARADFSVPFEKLDIPAPFKRAVIAHQGRLTPDFEYLYDFLK
ncbi:MAG: hypothetical protein D6677_13690 [Calditrichaeota bacterium]|nr:MAG: hypothetical protein D6677_13690 [Calditrichota bacterium]